MMFTSRAEANALSHKHGFTLLELLIVLAVITILFGILMSPIKAVRHHSRVTMARSELKMLEAAWKEYFAVYKVWPTNALDAAGTVSVDNQQGTLPETGIASMLEGQATEINGVTLNPKRIQFMEFTRTYGTEPAEPANPWCDQSASSNRFAYVSRFDTDYDNRIESPISGEDAIARSVIVWTTDADTGEIIGSWHQ